MKNLEQIVKNDQNHIQSTVCSKFFEPANVFS